jgi:hypothetical protein
MTALLLAPVPLFASYSLGTWTQVGGPTTWSTNTSSGSTLRLTPGFGAVASGTQEYDFVAPLLTGPPTAAGASTSNWNTFGVSGFSSNSGLLLTIGFATTNNPATWTVTTIYNNGNNQFNTGTLPAILPGTPTANSTSAPTANFGLVRFVFTGPSVWGPTVSSTTINVTFTGN